MRGHTNFNGVALLFIPLLCLKRQEIRKEVRNLKYFDSDHFIYDLSNIQWENMVILITQIWLRRFGKQILIQF